MTIKDTTTQQGQDDTNLNAEDLNLIDPNLEDETKEDSELWSEFDQAEAAATGATNDQTPGDAGGEGAGDDAGAATGAGDDDAAAGRDDSPAAKSGDDKSPDNKQQQPQDDVWANATPEQKAAYKRLEQADRSNRGRISAMQRQLNDLTKASQSAAAPDKGDASGKDGKEGADGFLATDDWNSFQEEYPEVAGPLGKFIGSLQAQITRQEKELSAIGTERRQSALDEQVNLLVEEHPDWQDLTADTGFPDWLSSQPRHIQEAAMRNANEIVDAAEAADVVGRFKAFRSAQQPNNPPASGEGDPNNRQQLSGKRQRQLESASTARSRGPGVASGIPEDGDPEALWKAFDEQERRQASA